MQSTHSNMLPKPTLVWTGGLPPSLGLDTPPPSASDHRRQSAVSLCPPWDESMAACSSGTLSPDLIHGAFTPASFDLLNTKLLQSYDTPMSSVFKQEADSGSPYSPGCQVFEMDLDLNQGSWHLQNKSQPAFRPAPLLSTTPFMPSQLDTPPNSASTSFDSGIQMMTPSSPSLACDEHSSELDTPYEFYGGLPTAPVVPSHIISGNPCLYIPQLPRNDSGFSVSTLDEYDASPYPASIIAHRASPEYGNIKPSFPKHKRSFKIALPKRTGRARRTKGILYNEVFTDKTTGQQFLLEKGRRILVNNYHGKRVALDKERKHSNPCKMIDAETGKPCTRRFRRKEHLNRHESMHTKIRLLRCPVPNENEADGFCKFRGSRMDNTGDHIAHHLTSWFKQFADFKTKGSPRTKPHVSPEEMQEIIIGWKGVDEAVKILQGLWRRVKNEFPDIDETHPEHRFTLLDKISPASDEGTI